MKLSLFDYWIGKYVRHKKKKKIFQNYQDPDFCVIIASCGNATFNNLHEKLKEAA